MFKSPWDWTVSMLRALKTPGLGERQNIAAMFTQLGQPVWRPGSPKGYDDLVATWAGSAALMQRVELANRIAGRIGDRADARALAPLVLADALTRTEEHTSELQSLMRISYAVFCWQKNTNT